MSSARTWGLRAGAIAFGMLLLGGAELALRASGTVADPPLPPLPEGWEEGGRFARSDARGVIIESSLDGVPGFRVGPPVAGNQMRPERWTAEPGATRVFAFGGSTTLGVPWERRPGTSFPEQLEAAAQSAGHALEVINLGGAGFSSTEVVDLAQQVVEQPAAAWVVYTGNNEFFRFSLDAWEAHRDRPSPRQNLQTLHLFRLIEDLLGEAPPPLLDVEAATEAQRRVVANVIAAGLAQPSARPQEAASGRWVRRDPAHDAVLRRFERNLETLETLAGQAGARLYLVDVQANLLQAPWLSLHDPTVPGRSRGAIQRLLAESGELRNRGQTADALAAAEKAVESDPMHAHSWHALGMARLDSGDPTGAAQALQAALDLDMDPGRPNRSLQRVLERVAADGGSTLVSLPDWEAPDHGLHGSDLFQDSCHLTEAGYASVGAALTTTLSDLPRGPVATPAQASPTVAPH